MDISSYYTNIDHEEGAEVCFKKLEQRKNKSAPSIVIKNLILMILKSNAFRSGNEYLLTNNWYSNGDTNGTKLC